MGREKTEEVSWAPGALWMTCTDTCMMRWRLAWTLIILPPESGQSNLTSPGKLDNVVSEFFHTRRLEFIFV